MAYFINLFTEETWRESREKGNWSVSGHNEGLRNRGKIGVGDIFICWVTKVSAVVGAERVVGEAVEVNATGPRIWSKALYPLRFPVELEVRVPVTEGVTLAEIRDHSSDPAVWGWIFRASGLEIPAGDAEWILEQLRFALSFDPATTSHQSQNPRRSHAAVARRDILRPSCVLRRPRIEVSWMYGSPATIERPRSTGPALATSRLRRCPRASPPRCGGPSS